MPFPREGRKLRSKIRWFTNFCNSHYVSHFAAFFIDTGAKISVVESCLWFEAGRRASRRLDGAPPQLCLQASCLRLGACGWLAALEVALGETGCHWEQPHTSHHHAQHWTRQSLDKGLNWL